jgi:hypothetical protein
MLRHMYARHEYSSDRRNFRPETSDRGNFRRLSTPAPQRVSRSPAPAGDRSAAPTVARRVGGRMGWGVRVPWSARGTCRPVGRRSAAPSRRSSGPSCPEQSCKPIG